MVKPVHALLILLSGFSVLAGPAAAYKQADVANGGTIKGTVIYKGGVPMRTILPTKDAKVCGNLRKVPLVLRGDNDAVAESVVYLKKVKKGKAWAADAPAPRVSNKGCRFVPHIQVIPAGKLSVVNDDPVLHNIRGFYGRRSAFNLALPNKGQTIGVDLKRSGTVRLECDAHGWMLGYIYVVDNPYYAITGEDGTFEITDVPPGKYTLVANQEHTGPTEMTIEVKAGETVSASIELKK